MDKRLCWMFWIHVFTGLGVFVWDFCCIGNNTFGLWNSVAFFCLVLSVLAFCHQILSPLERIRWVLSHLLLVTFYSVCLIVFVFFTGTMVGFFCCLHTHWSTLLSRFFYSGLGLYAKLRANAISLCLSGLQYLLPLYWKLVLTHFIFVIVYSGWSTQNLACTPWNDSNQL